MSRKKVRSVKEEPGSLTEAPRSPFRKEAALKQSELEKPTRLVLFRVVGRAVPWSVSRRGTKDKALIAWQEAIHYEAKKAYGIAKPPYSGPVGISLWFYIRPPDHRLLQTGDTTNYCKAFEDAMQKAVYVNDSQVFATLPQRIIVAPHDEERAYGEVWAIPRGEIESDGPEPYIYRPWQWAS
jgi:Holliday junction resolvase RusA-like endonuclease